MTDQEIQEHIKTNCRDEHDQPLMDEQTFFEGAKWHRDNLSKKDNDAPPVICTSQELQKELFILVNKYAEQGLSKPITVSALEWVLESVKKS